MTEVIEIVTAGWKLGRWRNLLRIVRTQTYCNVNESLRRIGHGHPETKTPLEPMIRRADAGKLHF